MHEQLYAVNWNTLNRQLTARRKTLARKARAKNSSALKDKFDNMSLQRQENKQALVAIGDVLSDRYHDIKGENPMTVYCDDVGGRNWAQRIRTNFFGAIVSSDDRGSFWILYHCCPAILN